MPTRKTPRATIFKIFTVCARRRLCSESDISRIIYHSCTYVPLPYMDVRLVFCFGYNAMVAPVPKRSKGTRCRRVDFGLRRFESCPAHKMTFPTHIIAGLIIGKVTWDYTAALAGSLFMDLDHLISYYKNGILFKPRAILRESLTELDPWGDQKNIFHSVQAWLVISLLVMAINLEFGLIFSLAYLIHLVMDALTGAFYPFYPYKKFQIKEPIIRYLSKRELVLGIALLAIFLIV